MTKFHFYFIMFFIFNILVRMTSGIEMGFYFLGCVLCFVCGVEYIVQNSEKDV